MTCGATRTTLNGFREGTLRDYVIALSAAKTFSAQSDMTAPFFHPAKGNITTSRAIALICRTTRGSTFCGGIVKSRIAGCFASHVEFICVARSSNKDCLFYRKESKHSIVCAHDEQEP